MLDEPHGSARECEESGLSAAGADALRRTTGRRVRSATVVIGLACAVAVAYYAPEIKGFASLQPWNRSAPARAVDAFAEAVRSSDQTMARLLAPGLEISDDCEQMRSPGKQARQPLEPVDDLLPGALAGSGMTRYDYTFGEARVTVPSVGGRNLTYTLARREGRWVVLEFGPSWEPERP